MNIDPKHLSALAVIIEKKSFSRAAEALGKTQPALSKIVADLERRFQVKLLEQRRNPVTPTPLGRQLAMQGYRIRGALDEAASAIAGVRDGERGLIRLGAPPFFFADVLPTLVLAFRETHPHVTFELRNAYRGELMDMIEARELEIALTPLLAEPTERPFSSHPLMHMSHAVVCRAGHPILGQPVTPERLMQQSWISQTPDSVLYDVMMNALSGLQVNNVEIVLQSESASALMAALVATDCLTVLPEFSVAKAINEGKLAILPTETLPALAFGATVHSTVPLSPAAQRFLAHVKAGFIPENAVREVV